MNSSFISFVEKKIEKKLNLKHLGWKEDFN
jgi:hypothetical protein